MTSQDYREVADASLRRELAAICDCTPEALPTGLDESQSMAFFDLSNPKTLQVWFSTGRHSLVWIKKGRKRQILTESAIQHRLKSLHIPENAA